MKTFKFEGSSDDTFGEYGVTNQDICNNSHNAPISCRIISKSEDHLLVVTGHYHIHPNDGCWTIGISLNLEGYSIPHWPIRMCGSDNEYSPRLEIDVPDDALLEWWHDGEWTRQ